MNIVLTAIAAGVRIGLPGCLWLAGSRQRPHTFGEWVVRCAGAATLGLGINLLLALPAAQLGWWTPSVDWAVWSAAVVCGALAGGGRRRGEWPAEVREVAVSVAAVAVCVALVLALPPRSEWLAGGWDPGLYQNQAVVTAESNGFTPRRDTIYAELTPAERALFSSGDESYRAVFPGVPMDAGTGSLPQYFFPLTPLCGALLYRLGGMDLLCRLGQLLGLLCVPLSYALAGAVGLRGRWQWLVPALWLPAPPGWYQQAIPTSEPLQLVLLLGAVVFYCDALASKRAWPWRCALLLAAGAANRFDLAALAPVLLVPAVVAEALGSTPGRRRRVLLCIVGLTAGAVWDLCFARVTLLRLQTQGNVLPLVLGPFAAGSLLALVLACTVRDRPPLAVLCKIARLGAAGAAIFLLAAILAGRFPLLKDVVAQVWQHVPLLGPLVERMTEVSHFCGLPLLCAALGGAAALAWSRDAGAAGQRVLVAGLAGVLLALFLHPGVAALYPWALRRYVVFLLPFLALCATHAVRVLASGGTPGRAGVSGASASEKPGLLRLAYPCRWVYWLGGRAGAISAVLLGLAILVSGVRLSADAFRVGDYVGLNEALNDLSRRTAATDVIVADDPRWGTPLLMTHDRAVLNGKLLWESQDPAYRTAFVEVLHRLQTEGGHRILWLTSTAGGMALYDDSVPSTRLIAEQEPFVYETIVHGGRVRRFAVQTKSCEFRLHEMVYSAGR